MKTQLLHGDCLQLLPQIASQSIDLIFADLPYGTTRNKWDTPIDLQALWKEYKRIIKSAGAIVLFAQTPFDKVLGASNLQWLRYEIIWEKTSATGHLNAKHRPMKAHENILIFYKRLPTYNIIKTAGHKRKTSVKRNDESTNYGKQEFEPIKYDSTERYPRSVLKGPSDKQRIRLNATQKPLWLNEWIIQTYSNAGDLVLDNCMGSGTSGVAAVQTGRNYIGMEKDKAEFEQASARIAAVLVPNLLEQTA